MKLFLAFIVLSRFSLLLQAEPTKVSCKGTNGKSYIVGDTYKIGCQKYVCENEGKLNVEIDATCCLHKGRYYQVGEVVTEIPNGQNCILEHTVCKENGQVVTEPVFGKCNCEYNGEMVKEGENVTLSTGSQASCCSGNIVTSLNKKTLTDPDVKLVGGIKPGMGNVYLNDNPVGDCSWNIKAASILCQELGFGDAIETPHITRKDSSKDFLYNFSIKCNGDEESFNDCKITEECNSGGTASVRCSRVKIIDNGKVLFDGEPLCVDGLEEVEATALCREVGFSTGMVKSSGSATNTSSSKKISCSGFLLSECITSECSKNSPMAALTCSNKMDIQLLGGNGENEGNVYFQGGPVCDDDFDIKDAKVVCRELGFDKAEQALTKSHFGLVKVPFTLDNVNCGGDETKLSQCKAAKESNCENKEGAGVICVRKTHSRRKRAAAAILGALPGVMDSGSNIVGSVLNYFSNKEKEHQKYLKERPDKVDLSNDKLTIKMSGKKGYLDPSGEFSAGGFKMDIGREGPSKKSKKDGGPAFTFTNGIGPMLMNGCFGSNYSKGDPCYAAKRFSTKCMNMIESANYVGVGFDGTGEYSHSSRKKSLIQRMCAAKSTYQGEDVPDIMNIFGIYDTACSGKSYDSLDARSEFQRENSDMGSNEDLLRYKGGSQTKLKGSIGFGTGSVSGSHSSYGDKTTKTKNSRSSKGSAESKAETTKSRIFEFMCKIRRYNIFLDEVAPSQLSSAFLEDYMSLPIRYYDFRQQAPLRYNRFLQRWGTHYIKSASFGGKFTLLRESRMHAKETKTEWAERIQEDTSQMFESKRSSVDANAKVSMWTASAEANINTKSTQNKDSSAKSSDKDKETNAKNKQASSFSMDDILVEGGDQKVASILSDKDRSGFKAEFTDWLESIPTYPKGYDFMFGELPELLNMNYRSLLNNKFKPCWNFKHRYNQMDDRGQLVCEKCLYDIKVKNKDGDEEIEVRKCQFQDVDDFQDKMDRKRLSLKRAIDIFVKNGGRSTTEVTLPGGSSQCESFKKAYNTISYKELISGETYQVDFDLREDMGDDIQKSETMYISFKQEDDNSKLWGRWALDDSTSNTFAGQYSKRVQIDEASKKVLINGVQFSYESGKSGNYLKMTESDCESNKERITSMEHQSCEEKKDLYWINIPLATVRPIKPSKTFHPCNLEWTNSNMLMSESSCVRFTATSMGPIYFALSAIPDRPDAMYYVRISPNDVTIYKNSILMDSKTTELAAIGLGHKDIFQSYLICSEHKKGKESNKGFTRITYGKLDADETMNKDATLNAYLIMKDDELPIAPTFFAFGSGEDKVHIADLELLDLPKINCRGNTINVNGQCVQACRTSTIAKMGKQTVSVKCYKEGSNGSEKANGDSEGHVEEGSYCVAECPNGEVPYPIRTVCKGDSTWTNELRCHKECERTDPSITNGILVLNGNKETKTLKHLTMDCPNKKDFGDLHIEGVKCNVVCGTDESGYKYNPIGQVECSDDSKWIVNTKKDQNVCKSTPCSPIKSVSNGILQCMTESKTEIKGGNTWSTAQGLIWHDRECPPLNNLPKLNLDACKTKCLNTPSCTAFNFHISGCVLRKCGYPVPLPKWNLGNEYKGYFIRESVSDRTWDFEDGTMQGFTLEDGHCGHQPLKYRGSGDDRWKVPANGGTFYVNTFRRGTSVSSTTHNDAQMCSFVDKTHLFTITKKTKISWVHSGINRVSLMEFSTNKELKFVENSRANFNLQLYTWDSKDLKDMEGKISYMKFSDDGSGGWEHIQIDNIHIENAHFSTGTQQLAKSTGPVSEGTECSIKICNARHKKEEPSTVTCSKGEWKHGGNVATLQCLPTDKTCPANIPAIEHGTVSCQDKDKSSDGTFFGATICNVVCDANAGYKPEDASSSLIQCVNGVWEVKTKCVDKSCPADLAKVDDGTVACDPKDKVTSQKNNFKSGSKCSVSCDASHTLQDAIRSTIQCNDGVWEVKAVCIDTYVLWLGKPSLTLNLPDLSRAASNCQITDPSVNPAFSQLQMINGQLYACNGEHCKTYNDDGKTWKILDGIKLKATGRYLTGIVMGDKWIIQGRHETEKGKLTTTEWSPGKGNWKESTIYKSPYPVSQHCLVAYQGRIMQIGGETFKEKGNTWSTAQGLIWHDRECPPLDNLPNLNLDACKTKCLNTPSCTAFNFHRSGCVLRKCGYPVPLPKWNLGNEYKGYFIRESEPTNKCFLGGKEVASLKADRMAHGCSLFQGKIWVAGGLVSGGNSAAVEVYNPQTNKWSDGPQLPLTVNDLYPQLVDIGNTLHYVGGGSIGNIYKLDNNNWVKVQDIEKGQKMVSSVMKKNCPTEAINGQWESWGSCTKKCGGGKKKRECKNPKPMNDGKACDGVAEMNCNSNPCPINGGWASWSPCSKTCGDGIKKRECNNPKPEHGGLDCVGEKEYPCKTKNCPINGGWGGWGSCSKSCGGGKKQRACNNPRPRHGGKQCQGGNEVSCNTNICPCTRASPCGAGGKCDWDSYKCTSTYYCGPGNKCTAQDWREQTCNSGRKCGLGGGDCNNGGECYGDLKCGNNNCPFGKDILGNYDDCCIKP